MGTWCPHMQDREEHPDLKGACWERQGIVSYTAFSGGIQTAGLLRTAARIFDFLAVTIFTERWQSSYVAPYIMWPPAPVFHWECA